MTNRTTNVLLSVIFIFGYFSCAPVKFSKSDTVVVGTEEGAIPQSIICNPKINDTQTTFTYATNTKPYVVTQCTPNVNLTYEWIVKNGSGAVIATIIPGLSGARPQDVDFTVLGEGYYYVFLKATDNAGLAAAFNASTPLEFIVPGAGTGGTLVCDPKLNGSFSSVVVGTTDVNPTVTAHCNPAAGAYIWTVTKGSGEMPVTVPGLSGSSSMPDFKALGAGDYRIYLHATLANAPRWESPTPLNVKVTADDDPPSGQILCSPRMNGTMTSLTITSSSGNPLISSNCAPSSVQYNWTVTKNGQTVAVSGLAGSNSNPDFLAQGVGTYLIYLSATKPNYTPWTAVTPLMLTVEGGGTSLAVNCTPRLDGQHVVMLITETGPNPTVTSSCVPVTAALTWTVTKNGQPMTLANLGGPSSVPDFYQNGVGTYQINLTATEPGYNAYVSPYFLEVVVTRAITPVRHVTFSKTVVATDNKVDILLVVDDSNSMLPDNRKLAAKMQGFVNDLTASGLDWQMCATLTRTQTINNVAYWGASRNWVNYLGSPKWILKLGATDPYAIFTGTIEQIGAGWAGTDDERAIKAAFWHAEYAASNGCYRDDASLAVIILSDEDERSIGGNMALQYYYNEWKALEADDYPQHYVNKIKQKFGQTKALSVNSIIVKPGDTACMDVQDAGGAAKSHAGYKYKELADLTQGYTGSICDDDYSQSLYYFKDKIVQSLSSIPLECAPIGPVAVTVTPAMGGITTQLVNNTLVFTPSIPAGRTIVVDYDCAVN